MIGLTAKCARELDDELRKESERWGHDDNRSAREWEDLIVEHANRLTGPAYEGAKPVDDYRELLIKIAAICISAVQSFDRTEITKPVEVPK